MIDPEILDEVSQIVRKRTKKQVLYLSKQENVYNELKEVTKVLHDLAVKRGNFSELPYLIIDGYDGIIGNEGIWQQLQLQNSSFLQYAIAEVSKLQVAKKPVDKVDGSQESELDESEEDGLEDNQMDSDEEENDDDNDSAEDNEKFGEFDDDDNSDGDDEKIDTKVEKNFKSSIVDDQFFKLDELDAFLRTEDEKEEKLKSKKEDPSDDDSEDEINDNDSFDYFEEMSSGSEDEKARHLKFKDFFDNPKSLKRKRLDEVKDSSSKKVQFNLDNEEEDESSNQQKENNTIKSTFEKIEERKSKKIEDFEAEAVSEKPWQLKGEVSSKDRPKNSLLEEFVEFDVVTRPAPIMTEQTTLKLEDVIKGRVKDKSWDDVEKKIKPVETHKEYKKKLVMNQEKSKESLAQIYENEFIKQRDALNNDGTEEREEKEPPEYNQIREAMHSVFRKLDALSNYHYTPKMTKPELKIVSNLPAINMEEVAPVATSDAALLAPEEIQEKTRGNLIGRTERTKTDMKRERRKKKIKQAIHAKNKEAKEKSIEDLTKSKKIQKKKMGDSELVKKLKKQRNVISVDESSQKNSKAIKSSTAFFTQLQDEVKSNINAKKAKLVIDKNKSSLSVMKLKF